MLKVKDIMRAQTVSLSPDTGLASAVSTIQTSGLLGLPVLDNAGNLIGFLSEQDCLKQLVTESYHCETHITVSDMMRKDPLYVSDDLTVFSLAQLMSKGQPKTFPVTRDDRLVGIVTRSDVVKALSHSLEACRVF